MDSASPAPVARRPPSIFRARVPGHDDVAAVLDALRGASYSYPEVGSTRGALPVGWHHDELSGAVGRGDDDARRVEASLRSWAMFDLGWVRPHRTDVPQTEGQMMAFTAFTLGLWTINVCRVVYRIEEDDGRTRRVGFAYGTLPGHVLCGEEQFLVTHDRASGDVTFSVRKFSRPNHPLIRLGGPLVRRIQRRFSEDALARLALAARGTP